LVRLLLVAALLVGMVQLLSPRSYHAPQGTISFQYRPLAPWEAGRVVLPLGPAGTLILNTHRTPVELIADFALEGRLNTVQEARQLFESRPLLQQQAEAAFQRFMRAQLPWAILVGIAAGGLLAGVTPRGKKRLLEGVLLGGAGTVLLAAAFGGLTLATVDRNPTIEYEGLAANAPEVLRVVRAVAQESDDSWQAADDFVRGLNKVAGQLSASSNGGTPPEGVVRILVASDMHTNLVGAALVSALARDERNPLAGIILSGDQTQRGSAAEATLLTERLRTNGVPIFTIGGNHESRPAMEIFKQVGHVMLGEYDMLRVAGLWLRGEDDPGAFIFATTPDEDELARVDAALLQKLQAGGRLPDILVLHNRLQAESVIQWAKEAEQPLTVVHGHSHIPSVEREGAVTVIDAGTSGSAGYLGVGRLPESEYAFQLLDFVVDPAPRLVSVTTLRYTGLTGHAAAQYFPIVD
jgi:predicted phosphodiesterase